MCICAFICLLLQLPLSTTTKNEMLEKVWTPHELANFAAFLALEPFVLAVKPVVWVEKQPGHSS